MDLMVENNGIIRPLWNDSSAHYLSQVGLSKDQIVSKLAMAAYIDILGVCVAGVCKCSPHENR